MTLSPITASDGVAAGILAQRYSSSPTSSYSATVWARIDAAPSMPGRNFDVLVLEAGKNADYGQVGVDVTTKAGGVLVLHAYAFRVNMPCFYDGGHVVSAADQHSTRHALKRVGRFVMTMS